MAEKDIAKYRLKQDEYFEEQRAIQELRRRPSEILAESNKSEIIETDFKKNKTSVIEELLERVLDVNLAVPRVLK